MVHHWRLFAEVVREGHWLDACVDRAQPDRQPLPKPDLRRVRVAMGPVVVFGASNFPLALSVAGSDSLTALAAGCPVVVKGHPSHPGTSELLARAVLRAIDAIGLPEGSFSMLQGTSQELGRQLVEHPATQAVGFTGSVRGGRALLDLAAARRDPIPVYAEMGSVNPQFVYPGILAKVASGFAERLFASVTMGNGQFCTCPSLVFVPAGKHTDTFVNRYRALVNASTGGLLLNPGIAAAYQDGIGRWADLKEVSLLARCPISNEGPAVARIDGATFLHHAELFLEEVFGPVTVVVVCESENDYIHLARVFPGQLGCSLHGTEAELAAKALPLMQELQRFAGRIVVNGFPTGIETSLAMHHGGPYPASTNSQHTSLGLAAIDRWTRPVCFQDTPDALLPAALQDANPLAIPRRLAALTAL